MKIVVCVKQVVDVTVPVRLDISTNRLPDRLNYMVNPVDGNATEEALRMKEKYGGEVVLLSAGPPRVEEALRDCLAMGCDQAVRVWHPDMEGGDAYVTAQVLAWAIASFHPDVILCGCQSLDEGTGQVPPALAEILDLPQVTRVTFLEALPTAKKLLAHRKIERGHRQVIECPLPAVVSVDASINHPRYPTFRSIRWAQKEAIQVLEARTEVNCPTQFVGLTSPRPRPKKTTLLDITLSPEDRLRQIMSGCLVEKDSTLWEGTPEELAARLVRVLNNNGFLVYRRNLPE